MTVESGHSACLKLIGAGERTDGGEAVSPWLVPARLQRAGLGRELDRPYRHHLDGARAVRRHGAVPGTRLLRLRAAGGLILCRRELGRFDRALPEARHCRAAAGPVGGGLDHDAGDVAHRHRADLRHLRLSALSAGAADRDPGPGVVGPHRLERGHRQFGLRGDELRLAGHAGARPALRHGRRVHGGLPAALGVVGAGRDRRRPAQRIPGRSHQGPCGELRRPVLQDARAAELGSVSAGPAGDRTGRRFAARAAVRLAIRRHDRRAHQGRRRR